MDDLISRRALIAEVKRAFRLDENQWWPLRMLSIIENMPGVEAEVRGEWRFIREGCVLVAECSNCGTVQNGIAAAQWDHCPVCGANTSMEDER